MFSINIVIYNKLNNCCIISFLINEIIVCIISFLKIDLLFITLDDIANEKLV